TEVTVLAPAPRHDDKHSAGEEDQPQFEIEELKVNLGQQVQAGQTLCVLAHHHDLLIEGRAFPQEAALLQRAADQQQGLTAEVPDEKTGDWPALPDLKVRFLSTQLDPATQTLPFYLTLPNERRAFVSAGQTRFVWRFRPGQRVRLWAPVKEFT